MFKRMLLYNTTFYLVVAICGVSAFILTYMYAPEVGGEWWFYIRIIFSFIAAGVSIIGSSMAMATIISIVLYKQSIKDMERFFE